MRRTTERTTAGSLPPALAHADLRSTAGPAMRDTRCRASATRSRIRTWRRSSASRLSPQRRHWNDAASPTESASPGGRGWTSDLLAIDDPTLREIVGRHFHVNTVADDRADPVPAHLSRGVGDNSAVIVEHDAEAPVRQYLVDHPFDGEQLFFRHGSFSSVAETP